MGDMLFYVIGGLAYLFAQGVQQSLKKTYATWSKVPSGTGKTGGLVARTILNANDLEAVPVQAVNGTLTDHYDPANKQLRLSRGNFVGESISATAVAAHECGHAIQDAQDYRPMEIRTALMPIANLGSRFGIPMAIGGSILGLPILIQVGMLCYVGALLLTFLTLPVEFNASRRALQQLEELGLVTPDGKDGAKKVLRAAAMTYVAGVAQSAGYIVYLFIVFGSSLFRRKRDPLPPRV